MRSKNELADAHCQTVTIRNNWMQVNEDLEKEHKKELQKKDRKIKQLENQLLKTERILDSCPSICWICANGMTALLMLMNPMRIGTRKRK